MVAVKRTVPDDFASTLLCTAVRDAAPPMWNVRIVSCVPGSHRLRGDDASLRRLHQ